MCFILRLENGKWEMAQPKNVKSTESGKREKSKICLSKTINKDEICNVWNKSLVQNY